MPKQKAIILTGADGFVGKNLRLRLGELDRFAVRPLIRSSSNEEWRVAMRDADAVIHLAGVNRPIHEAEFEENSNSVRQLVVTMERERRVLPVILTSSIKATETTPYGRSKHAAEDALLDYARRTAAPAAIYRLPNIFGKWCRPNYNSAVATFCHNVARGFPIKVNDPTAALNLIYIDDVMDTFIAALDDGFVTGFAEAGPIYCSTVGEIAALIRGFGESRKLNAIDDVGTGLIRALYSTFVSYLPPDAFAYPITSHRDERGAFSEMLKTRSAGQFSYFTAVPGSTRGGHYHHTKTERFLIVHGEALFRFRHVLTGESREVRTSADDPCVVETIPGWTHDVTNVGQSILVSLIWANEVFDRTRPDTVMEPV